MADKVESQEIGNYKTPEDLAKALEEKSNNTLAKRVREISGKVQDNSIDLRKKLQDELTPEEQSEIRETLPDSGVEKVFDKKTTKDIGEDAVSGVIGEENSKKLKKVEGIRNRLSTGFDKIGDIFEEKGFMAGLGAIILMFKGIFSGDFSGLDKILNPNEKKEVKDEGKKEGGKESNDTNIINNFTIKVFIEYSYTGENKDKIGNIAQKENFKKLSLKEIQEIKKDENKLKDWIKETYGNSPENFSLVKKTFELFSDGGKGKDTLKRVLGQNYNEDLKITETLSLADKDLHIFEHVSSLNPEDLLKSGSEMIRFDVESFKNGEPPKIFNERGINKELGTFILTNKTIKIGDNIEPLIANTLGDSEKKKFRELMDFGKKIQEQIKNNEQLNLGMGKDISKNLDINPLNIVEITKLYTVLGGETDFKTMNEFKQSFMYFSVGGILDNGRSNIDQGTYIVKLADLIKDGVAGESSKIKIPEGVLNFMGAIGNGLVDYMEKSLLDWGITFAGGFKETVKKYPGLLAVMVGIILLYPFAQRRSILGIIAPKFGGKKI